VAFAGLGMLDRPICKEPLYYTHLSLLSYLPLRIGAEE